MTGRLGVEEVGGLHYLCCSDAFGSEGQGDLQIKVG